MTQQNLVAKELAELLLANNEAAQDDCKYLESAITSWVNMAAVPQPASLLQNLEDTYVLWAQLLPPDRCENYQQENGVRFQQEDGVLTFCEYDGEDYRENGTVYPCHVWDDQAPDTPSDATEEYFAAELDIRLGGVRKVTLQGENDYRVSIIYNQNPTVSLV